MAAPAPAPRKWEGVVDEALERDVLGACLDQAPERRRVREAFKDVQLSIDHCLFKVPNPLKTLFLEFLIWITYSAFSDVSTPDWSIKPNNFKLVLAALNGVNYQIKGLHLFLSMVKACFSYKIVHIHPLVLIKGSPF